MPHYTIDRFEGSEWAVLEDERARTFSVPRQWIPAEAREGDVVTVSEQAAMDARVIRFAIDASERDERLADADRRREALPRGPKGDLAL